jgi:phage terminase small subunit
VKKHCEQSLGRKRLRFVDEYLKDSNATQAAIRAGYSPSRAKQTGHDLVTNRDVQKAIAERGAKIAAKCEADSEYVLRKAVACLETSVGDFLVFPPDGGTPTFDLAKATPEKLACVDSLHIDEDVVAGEDGKKIIKRKIRITLPKRRDMLETIGKHAAVNAFKESVAAAGNGAPMNIEINVVGVRPGELDASRECKTIN